MTCVPLRATCQLASPGRAAVLPNAPALANLPPLPLDENPENRWILPFNQAMMKAFDALEDHLENDAGDGPAALLTVSANPKFFSNGIDPTGSYSQGIGLGEPSKEDQLEGIILGMPGFIRPLQLPIPTVAAINGHAFGAGMMFAVAHDYRLQREDRGYMW